MKVALVYDWIHTTGGAERILIELHKLFPNAPLFTSVFDKKGARWALEFKIKTSFLQKIPYASTHHELYPILTPIAFESFDFSEFDVVVSVTSTDAKGIITKPNTFHICYLLTPTRYLWSHHDFYFKNKILKYISTFGISYLKKWDLVAKSRPDKIVAISNNVKKRIKKYYKRDTEVVYPPVDTNKFTINKRGKKSYFLVVSRLVPYKQIDLPIKTCNILGFPLKIVGVGRALKSLKKSAGPSVHFVGNLTEDELISYYQNCRAVIIPSEEDFGIVAVEAQACGKPVVAFGHGGVLETVIKGKTGVFFNKQTVESLTTALVQFKSSSFNQIDCVNNSKKFSKEIFITNFTKLINERRINKL